MNKFNSWIETACALLIFLFLYTGLSKYISFRSFEIILRKSPLLGGYAGVVAMILPGVEILVALLLAIPRTRLYGLGFSFLLLVLFTLYLIYIINFAPILPCSCGGVLQQLSWKQHIFLNLFFLLVASLGLFLIGKRKGVFPA